MGEKEQEALCRIAALCLAPGVRSRELLRAVAGELALLFPDTEKVRVRIHLGKLREEYPAPADGAFSISGGPAAEDLPALRTEISGPPGGGGGQEGEILLFRSGGPGGAESLERTRRLLVSAGSLLGESVRRLRADRRLRLRNVALREAVIRLEGDRRRFLRRLRLFIEGRVLPQLRGVTGGDADETETALRRLGKTLEALPGRLDLELRLEGYRLSPREREICDLIRGGMTSKEMAVQLGLSELTVERHRHNIRRKLGVEKNRSLAAFLARF